MNSVCGGPLEQLTKNCSVQEGFSFLPLYKKVIGVKIMISQLDIVDWNHTHDGTPWEQPSLKQKFSKIQ